MNEIMVRARCSRKTCMQIFVNRFYPLDSNILRQQPIQLVTQLMAVKLFYRIKVRNHHRGMNSCIRASCTSDSYFFTQNKGQSFLQLSLHRNSIGLHLPSMKSSSVVT